MLAAVGLVTVLLAGPALAQASAGPGTLPAVQADSAILIDVSDGSVLWAKNPDERRAIASTTKIMTALVTLENTGPDDVVTASARAEQVGETDPLVTELELVAGEQLTVAELLYGLMLPSGNDAAVALAEHVGGSLEGFARLMNEKAKSLGADDTNFVTPNGLDHPDAYSTARDLARISRAAMANETFEQIVATRSRQIRWPGQAGDRQLVNRNQLLGTLEGATGVKTGNTRLAGPSLVSSATRGEESRLAVVLGSPDVFGESARVLEYGFDGFSRHYLARSSEVWGHVTYGDGTTVQVVPTEDVSMLLVSGQRPPETIYRPEDSVLVVLGPQDRTVPVVLSCEDGDCPEPARGGGFVAAFMYVFAPLLGVFR